MSNSEIVHIIFVVIILSFLVLSYIRSRKSENSTFAMLAGWVSIFLMLITIYAFRFELKDFKNRILAVLIPSYSWSSEPGQIRVSRHQNGHFYLYGYSQANRKVEFLVDTGATNIALNMSDAIKLGIDVNNLRYTQRYSTANGINYGAPVIIPYLRIGEKVFTDVRAHIIRTGLDTSLLGMSLIDDFKDFQISRDMLILNY